MGYRFGVLGPFELYRDDEPRNLVRTKSRLLLALLLVNAGRRVSIEHLVTELWTDPPRSAAANLRTAVRDLRLVITGADLIVTQPHGYEIRVPEDAFDLRRYENLVAAANTALGQNDPELAVELFAEADGRWRGAAFEGLRQSPTLAAIAEAAETLRLTTMDTWSRARLRLGGDPALITDLRRHLAVHPLRERCWETLIRAIAASGDVETALHTYQEARSRLIEQLGVEPGPHLHELHRAILNRDPAVVSPVDQLAPRPTPPSRGSTQPPRQPCQLPRPPCQRPRQPCQLPRQPCQLPRQPCQRPQPAQLPADLAAFTGRTEQLRHLNALLDRAPDRDRTTVALISISGGPGVGKTALAVRFAHQVRHRFPDGQLYANLRGFGPSGSAAAPDEIVVAFLEALGVSADQLPSTRDARTALFRSFLADRRMLLLLDNARSAAQVRPLLPAAPGCLVIVTSRTQLTGLTATDGAYPVALDLLTDDEARELLALRIGRERLAAEPAATTAIVAGCARLPRALTVAAAHAASRPDFPLSALANRLHDARGRLEVLATDDPATDLRAAFSWSYRTLTPPAARLFRLLGRHDGPHVDVSAATALAGTPPEQTRTLLAELARAQLLAEHAPGRYQLQDLLRTYALELANPNDVEVEVERSKARHRLFDRHVRTAHRTDGMLAPARDAVELTSPLQDAVA